MSHNIELNKEKGTYSFATAKEKAWHELGTLTPGLMSTAEALELANMDFQVQKVPNYIKVGDQFVDAGSYSTVREDNNAILGNRLGEKYTVLQNKEAFNFFDVVLEESESIIETAGCLGDGSTVFITAKLPQHFNVGDDVVDQYLLVSNSHDGSSAITVMFTPVRVVCNNTLNFALAGRKNKVSIRHTSGVKDALAAAKNILGIQNAYADGMRETMEKMQELKMNQKQFDNFLVKILTTPAEAKKLSDGSSLEDALSTRKLNTIADMKEYYLKGVGQNTPGAVGTRYGAFNAVTGYYQNVNNYKNGEQKYKSILTGGTAAHYGQKAFNELIKA